MGHLLRGQMGVAAERVDQARLAELFFAIAERLRHAIGAESENVAFFETSPAFVTEGVSNPLLKPDDLVAEPTGSWQRVVIVRQRGSPVSKMLQRRRHHWSPTSLPKITRVVRES
jgi:hypothetical protein